MKNENFIKWAGTFDPSAKPNPQLNEAIFGILSGYKDADALLTTATSQRWTPEKMTAMLKEKGQNVGKAVEAIMAAQAPASDNRAELIARARQRFAAVQGQDAQAEQHATVSPVFSNAPIEQGYEQAYQPSGGGGRAEELRKRRAQQSEPKKSLFGGLLGKFSFGKKSPKPAASHASAYNAGPRPGGGGKSSAPTAMIAIVALVAIALVIGGYFMSQNKQVKKFLEGPTSSGAHAVACVNENPIDLKGQKECSKTGKIPADGWIVAFMTLGVALTLAGDIKFRGQWLDGISAILMALATIFVNFSFTASGAVFVLLLELFVVTLASIMGGRDFSPMAGYFLLVGLFGGLVSGYFFGNAGIVTLQTIFPTVIAGHVNTISWAFANLSGVYRGSALYTLLVDMVLIIGAAFALFECVRKAEDKTPRFGTLIAGGLGLLAFFGMYFLLPQGGGLLWVAYVVGVAAAIAVAALSQNERVVQTVTMKWGVRSVFDGGMLVTAVLVILIVVFGLFI